MECMGVASGNGWNLWVWLAGGGCGWNLWVWCKEVYRLLHITSYYLSLLLLYLFFFCSSIPTFCSFKKCFLFLFCFLFLHIYIYGMGHKKVPVFCKTMIVQWKFCIPFPCPLRSATYFRVYFCYVGKII